VRRADASSRGVLPECVASWNEEAIAIPRWVAEPEKIINNDNIISVYDVE
jgi:hypothetical protein